MNIKACISKHQMGRGEKTALSVREGLEMWLLRCTWWVSAACRCIMTTQKMCVLFRCDRYLHPRLLSTAPLISRDAQWGALRAQCPWDVTHCTEGLHLPQGKPELLRWWLKGRLSWTEWTQALEQGSPRVVKRNTFSFPSISHEHLHGAILASQLTNRLVEVDVHNLRLAS